LSQPNVEAIYFSPTNTTGTVVQHISRGLGQDTPLCINLANIKEREDFFNNSRPQADDTDFVIIGMPVYVGKIPRFLMEHFQKIDGKGKATIAVVVYGNRGFDMALKQLVSLLDRSNYSVIGAGAFIGEHSFSSQLPISQGRPDEQDRLKAVDFGEQIRNSRDNLKQIKAEDVPGKRNIIVQMMPDEPPAPTFHPENCQDCGLCVTSCPMGAIDPQTKRHKSNEARKACLGCMRCVRGCPHNARSLYFSPPVKALMCNWLLKEAIRTRREPVTILKR